MPLLVYLPGWMSLAATARAFLAPLSDTLRCWCPDLPGSETTPFHPIGPSTAMFARWVLGEIDRHYGDQPFILMGNSMGGMIAQELALLAPARVQALILLATTAYFQDAQHRMPVHVWEALLQYRSMASPREFICKVLPYLVTPDQLPVTEAYFRSLDPFLFPKQEALDERYTAMQTHDTRNRLPILTCPTLVLHGAQDQLIPVNHGKTLASCITTARFHCIQGAGHTIGAQALEYLKPFFSHLQTRPDQTILSP